MSNFRGLELLSDRRQIRHNEAGLYIQPVPRGNIIYLKGSSVPVPWRLLVIITPLQGFISLTLHA